ncbi:MAG: RdgB/HAM1 family non-canonical purine NTP pyrophosphatase [Chloroflexota bacterium]|nr:RdgB/HAM1 family non-canonical purine NTP pyrophosphatase [Chloroflexia bacterium]MDQ3167257.1 RdgB/HAM1 family non-canonical purine NTP pyrophosphatase [Chloroflexota bacterium]
MTDPPAVPVRRILLATSNPGKAREFLALLPRGIEVVTLADLGLPSPPEDGVTLDDNAVTKALAGAVSGYLTVADDSGLEVDALGGAPGVHSARYAGTTVSDAANREKLLAQMRTIEPGQRTARFRCVVAIAGPSGLIATAGGHLDGVIAPVARGDGGFGYDPVFELPDGRTLAEIPLFEKNAISHRGRAYRAALPALRACLDASRPEGTGR